MKNYILCLIFLISFQAVGKTLPTIVQEASEKTYQLKKSDDRGDFFDLPSNLGTYFTSNYFVFRFWMEDFNLRPNDTIQLQAHLKSVIKAQRPDGSWFQVNDPNIQNQGHLDSTIMHYWLLKMSGTPLSEQVMIKAQNYIRHNGGIEKSSTLTKIFLALFDIYSWKNIPKVPYLLFKNSMPVNENSFGAWMKPMLLPISFLRKNQIHKNLGERFSLDEIYRKKEKSQNKILKINASDEKMLLKMLSRQEALGSWGGYTLSSILVHMSLAKSGKFSEKNKDLISKSYEESLAFNEELHFNKGAYNLQGAYGDGHLWDTMLISGALIEAGIPEERLYSSLDRLITYQTPNGGFPFGLDFSATPDVDDTAEAVITLSRIKNTDRYKESIDRSIAFILNMQNKDGGWGAFAKNNNGNWFLKLLGKKFEDTSDLFDESSADVTGHVLEALGLMGYTYENSIFVSKAVNYLAKTHQNGIWKGRWGVNYIYGTSAVVVGLLKVGIAPDSPLIKDAVAWIYSKQNHDGGWGETTASDIDPTLAGVGISTPTQTSWALAILLEAEEKDLSAIEKGMIYLSKSYDNTSGWIDNSAVGTGHPKILYMVYPSYPKAFPLMMISRYLKHLSPK